MDQIDQIAVIDGATNKIVATWGVGWERDAAANPTTNRLYVTQPFSGPSGTVVVLQD